MKPKQLSFFAPVELRHGGEIRKGKRKIARPIDTKRPMHIVLRARKARGVWSFLHKNNKGIIALLLVDVAERFGVKILRYENVGNHIHLLATVKKRKALQNFLRVFPQKVMFAVTGAKKGDPKGKFWDSLVFTRVIHWGKEYHRHIKDYFWKNRMEALGFKRDLLKDWWTIPIG